MKRLLALIPRPDIDPWDALGACGLFVLTVGVVKLSRWPWGAVLDGGVLVAVYIIRAWNLTHPHKREEN